MLGIEIVYFLLIGRVVRRNRKMVGRVIKRAAIHGQKPAIWSIPARGVTDSPLPGHLEIGLNKDNTFLTRSHSLRDIKYIYLCVASEDVLLK